MPPSDPRSEELIASFRERLAEIEHKYSERWESVRRGRPDLPEKPPAPPKGESPSKPKPERRAEPAPEPPREEPSAPVRRAEPPSPVPAARPLAGHTSWLLAGMALLCLAAGAGGLWLRGRPKISLLPINHTAGLVELSGVFYTVDWLNQELFAIDPKSAQVLGSKHFPNPFPAGLAQAAGKLWSLDGDGGLLLRHSTEDSSVELSRKTPCESPSALAADPSSLWIADGDKQRIYRLALPDLGLLSEGGLPARPAALLREGEELWELDPQARLHILKASDLSEQRTLSLSQALPRGAKPTGMALRQGRLWLISENPAALGSAPRP